MTWLKRKRTAVFIDNSALKSVGYNFESKSMESICDIAYTEDIQIAGTQILKREFVKHFYQLIKEDEFKINKLKMSRYFKEAKKEATEILNVVRAEEEWQHYLDEFKVKMCDSDINWRDVFDDYFFGKPPFSVGKKKNEFPDAFNLKLLENEFKNFNIVVISGDKDFSGWADNKKKFHFRSLKEFIDSYFKIAEEVFYNDITKVFEENKHIIESRIKESLKENSIYETNSYNTDVEDVEILNLELNLKEITSIDKESEMASFSLEFSGIVILNLYSAVYVRDPVDRDIRFEGYNRNSIELPYKVNYKFDLYECGLIENEEEDIKIARIDIDPNWEDEVQY